MRVRRTATVLLAVAASAVLLSSCGSSSGSSSTASPSAVTTTGSAAADLPSPSQAQVVGTWSVFVLPAKPGPSEQKVTFTETELTTSDGCNTATAGYTLGADGAFKLGEVAQTTKACPKPDSRHIEALQSATRVGLDTRSGFDQLVFTDAQGSLVLVLQRDQDLAAG